MPLDFLNTINTNMYADRFFFMNTININMYVEFYSTKKIHLYIKTYIDIYFFIYIFLLFNYNYSEYNLLNDLIGHSHERCRLQLQTIKKI